MWNLSQWLVIQWYLDYEIAFKLNTVLGLSFFADVIFGDYIYIYIYSFGRRFYPKRLTIGEYIKRLILKRQSDRGSARNTKSQSLFK